MLKDPDLTVEILRLGAIANALNAVTTMSATSRSSGVGRDRDTQQTGLLVASYLKEAIEVDITNLELNSNMRVQDVIAENMEVMNSPRIPIASIVLTRALKQEATEAEKAGKGK